MSHHRNTVSAQWLKDNLHNPDIVIVDCRFRLSDTSWGYQQYLSSHIPKSQYLHLENHLSSPLKPHGGRHPLPNPDLLSQTLANIGVIKNQTLVVAYDDSRFAFSARLWWLLRFFDHPQVVVLDGGWQEWTNLGYPTETEISTPSKGNFSANPLGDKVVDIDYVRNSQVSTDSVIIDARSHERFIGKYEPIDPVAGSIPQAKNVFWQEMTTEDGKLKSLTELQNLWQPYQSYSEIIVYCGSGVTACVDLLALEEINLKTAKLYGGGWSDWCSYASK